MTMTNSRKSRAALIQDAIRKVLRRDWDPIGLGDALPEDEYDAYIAPVYRILSGNRSEPDLVECLSRMEADVIGAPRESTERLQSIARTLLAIDVRLSPSATESRTLPE
jgi:hypothetical protein